MTTPTAARTTDATASSPPPTDGPAVRNHRLVDILGALSGAVFVVLILVGNSLAEEGGSPTVGLAIELLGFAALAVFLAHLAVSFGGRSRAAVLAVIGGAILVTVKLASGAPMLAAEAPGVDPDLAAALLSINEAAFAISFFPHGLLVAGLATACLITRRLPRPVGYLGAMIGVACTAAVVPSSVEEPFVLPFLLSLLWLIVASVLLARRAFRGGSARHAVTSTRDRGVPRTIEI